MDALAAALGPDVTVIRLDLDPQELTLDTARAAARELVEGLVQSAVEALTGKDQPTLAEDEAAIVLVDVNRNQGHIHLAMGLAEAVIMMAKQRLEAGR